MTQRCAAGRVHGADGSTHSADPALPPDVVHSAVDWLVQLWSGDCTEEQRAQWLDWRAAHPLLERAWQRIEATNARLRLPDARPNRAPLNGPLATATLARSLKTAQSRRRLLATKTATSATTRRASRTNPSPSNGNVRSTAMVLAGTVSCMPEFYPRMKTARQDELDTAGSWPAGRSGQEHRQFIRRQRGTLARRSCNVPPAPRR